MSETVMSYEDITYALDGAGDDAPVGILTSETPILIRGILDGRPVLANVTGMSYGKTDNGDTCVFIDIGAAK